MPKRTRRVWSWIVILRKVEGEMIKAVNHTAYNNIVLPDTSKRRAYEFCV